MSDGGEHPDTTPARQGSVRPGGSVDLDHAELFPVFLAESEENLADIEESVLHLETDPDDAEVIDRLFRCAHTLKGNSESLGIDAMASPRTRSRASFRGCGPANSRQTARWCP